MPPSRKSKKLQVIDSKIDIIRKELKRRKRKLLDAKSPRPKKRARYDGPLKPCVDLIARYIKLADVVRHFREPVDWRALQLPNYPKIIKNPMDVGTVKQKLHNGEYKTVHEFAHDMRLVWQNAMTFNPQPHPIHKAARKLSDKFEKDFENLVEESKIPQMNKTMLRIVNGIWKDRESTLFRAPVDWKALNIPDYPNIIKHPMDLGTIKNRIATYPSFDAFYDDLCLVWSNAMTYNPSTNIVHQQAKRLSDLSEKLVAREFPDELDNYKQLRSGGYIPNRLASGQLASVMNSDQGMMQSMAVSQGLNDMSEDDDDGGEDGGESMDEDDEEAENPETLYTEIDFRTRNFETEQTFRNHYLSDVEKRQLQLGVQLLDADRYSPLLNILHDELPDQMAGQDSEFELDIEQIPLDVQVKLFYYVMCAIRQQKLEDWDNQRLQTLSSPSASIAMPSQPDTPVPPVPSSVPNGPSLVEGSPLTNLVMNGSEQVTHPPTTPSHGTPFGSHVLETLASPNFSSLANGAVDTSISPTRPFVRPSDVVDSPYANHSDVHAVSNGVSIMPVSMSPQHDGSIPMNDAPPLPPPPASMHHAHLPPQANGMHAGFNGVSPNGQESMSHLKLGPSQSASGSPVGVMAGGMDLTNGTGQTDLSLSATPLSSSLNSTPLVGL